MTSSARYWRWKEDGLRGELRSGMVVIVRGPGESYLEAVLRELGADGMWLTSVPELLVRDSFGMLVLVEVGSPGDLAAAGQIEHVGDIEHATTCRDLRSVPTGLDSWRTVRPTGRGWRNVGVAVGQHHIFWTWERTAAA